MKATFLTSACLLIHMTILAQSQGPFTAGNLFNQSIPGSSSSWINVSNARISDNQYSSFGNLPDNVGVYTDYLVATGFNFNIPAATTITGVVVEIENADPNQVSTDYGVYLYLNGPSGENHSRKTTYQATDEIVVYGSSTDLWVESLDYGKVNDPGFGVAIAVQREANGASTQARIDDIRITVYYSFIILPVQLLSFTAVTSTQYVNLCWTTCGESSMDRFEVERSADGINYKTITSLPARNRVTNNNYSVLDNFPLPGNTCYRLKMIGISGDVKYSSVIVVQSHKEASRMLYPNPVSVGEKLRIHNPAREELYILFFDLSGKLKCRISTRDQEMILPEGILKGELVYRIENSWHLPISTGRIVIE